MLHWDVDSDGRVIASLHFDCGHWGSANNRLDQFLNSVAIQCCSSCGGRTLVQLFHGGHAIVRLLDEHGNRRHMVMVVVMRRRKCSWLLGISIRWARGTSSSHIPWRLLLLLRLLVAVQGYSELETGRWSHSNVGPTHRHEDVAGRWNSRVNERTVLD